MKHCTADGEYEVMARARSRMKATVRGKLGLLIRPDEILGGIKYSVTPVFTSRKLPTMQY